MTSLLEKQRAWDYVRDPEKVAYLLREKLSRVRFYIKHTDPPAEVYRGDEREGGFEFHHAVDIPLKGKVTLYATLKRQLEVDLDAIGSPEEGTTILKAREVRIGKTQREFPRYNITNDAIYAANFQVSKNEIAVDNTRPQVANKVIFSEFEKTLSREIPGLHIFDYATRERPEETRALNKETRTIYVRDISDLESYRPVDPGFFDYRAYLEDEAALDRTRRRLQENQYQSLIVMPILYEMADGSLAPIAFFHVATPKGHPAGVELVERLKKVSEEIIDRIQDASMISVKDRQTVIDISEGGVALELTHPDLIKYVPHRTTITFDLIFKMQAPLRFRGTICHMEQSGNDSLFVGLNLEGEGHSDFRTGARERLRSLVHLLSTSG